MNITGNSFDKASLQIMLDSKRWKLACSKLPMEVPELSTEQHRRWLARNTDKHPYREILFALQGKSLSSLNGVTYLCAPGSLFLFDKFETHDRAYSPVNEDIKHLWLFLVEEKIVARIVLVRNRRLEYSGHDLIINNINLAALISEAWDSLKKNDLPEELKRRKLLSAISLCMLELIELDLECSGKTSAKTYQAETIEMIKGHILSTSGRNLTVDKLARIAGYSKFHFLRLFRQYTGESIHKYINTVRISKVRSMLKNGRSKKEIAEKLGFSCASSFSHWLRKNLQD
jgi:AraC-like DNA-binding protein